MVPETTVRQVKNAAAHSFQEADTVRESLCCFEVSCLAAVLGGVL